jgi:tetratricopeptide (TPR) repeat protein
MERARFRLCASLALIVAAAAVSAPAQADRASRERARALFKAGKAAYAAGQYGEAARLFSDGYELDRQPAFLLNAAQSFRSAAKHKEALEQYRKYLQAAPDTKLREQVEELIRDLEQKVKAESAPPPTPPPAVTPPPPPPVETPEPTPSSPPIYKRWWFWTAIGAVVVGTGVGLGAYYGTREPSYVKEGGLGSVRW